MHEYIEHRNGKTMIVEAQRDDQVRVTLTDTTDRQVVTLPRSVFNFLLETHR